MVLGIDNGLSGALVALSSIAGLPPVEMISMPVMQVRLRHREFSLAKAKGGKAKGRVKNVMENLKSIKESITKPSLVVMLLNNSDLLIMEARKYKVILRIRNLVT